MIWALLCYCSIGFGEEEEEGFYDKKYSLIIGVSDYKDATAWPRLPNAVNDVKDIWSLFNQNGFKGEALIGPQATREAILDRLDDIAQKSRPDDAVFIYFAGHGSRENLNGLQWGYIVPYDASRKTSTFISMEQLRERQAKISAKHTVIVLDSCYGGLLTTATRESTTPAIGLQLMLDLDAKQMLTSGGATPVTDEGPRGHSIFATAFLKAIGEGAADVEKKGYVTFSELSVYVKTHAKTAFQEPEEGKFPNHKLGSFIFRVPGRPLIIPPGASLFGATRSSVQRIDELVEKLNDTDINIAVHAADEISKMNMYGEQAVYSLIEVKRKPDTDPELIVACSKALAAILPFAVVRLKADMEGRKSSVAAMGIIELGQKPAISIFHDIIRAKISGALARSQAAASLGVLRSPSSVSLLTDMLRETKPFSNEDADGEELIGITYRKTSQMYDLRRDDISPAYFAAEALGSIGPAAIEAIPKLNNLIKVEKSQRLRSAASEAIQLIQADRKQLLKILGERKNDTDNIREFLFKMKELLMQTGMSEKEANIAVGGSEHFR